jgi:hypothetical protein
MKGFLLALFMFVFCNCGYSQDATSKYAEPAPYSTNYSRYQIDYEVKGWTGAIIQDSSKINLIKLLDLEFADSKRKATEDVEVYDTNAALTIIVYSEQKAYLIIKEKK